MTTTMPIRQGERRTISGTVLPQRFWDKIAVDANGCWVWQGSRKGGELAYGAFNIRGAPPRSAYAHRVAYEALVGLIPKGLRIDHLCMNPPCVNPAHMEPVTHSENLRRGSMARLGVAHPNLAKTHCPQGHLYDEANTYHMPRGGRGCHACRKRRGQERRAQEQAA